MIVVADTSPLNYLVLIRAVDTLQLLYGRILVPRTVASELRQTDTPATVRAWIAEPPEWCEIWPDPPADASLSFLDPGERAAITLALAVDSDRLLIDERDGRAEAERRGLYVTGTLGALAEGHLAGLLDFDEALGRLRSTNFRLHPDVEIVVRRRLAAQKKTP